MLQGTIYIVPLHHQNVCLAQLDRAFGYGPKGRGFESSNTREFVYLHRIECTYTEEGLANAMFAGPFELLTLHCKIIIM